MRKQTDITQLELSDPLLANNADTLFAYLKGESPNPELSEELITGALELARYIDCAPFKSWLDGAPQLVNHFTPITPIEDYAIPEAIPENQMGVYKAISAMTEGLTKTAGALLKTASLEGWNVDFDTDGHLVFSLQDKGNLQVAVDSIKNLLNDIDQFGVPIVLNLGMNKRKAERINSLEMLSSLTTLADLHLKQLKGLDISGWSIGPCSDLA